MAQDAPSLPTVAPRSVLVVDDDYGTRMSFQWALRRTGFLVDTAASGEQGLVRIRSTKFDLLLLDLRLPDMSGTTLIRTLLSERRLPPFFLISGFLDTPSIVDAVRLGAHNVLEKPIDVDDLIRIVRSCIEDRRVPQRSAKSSNPGAQSKPPARRLGGEFGWPTLPLSARLCAPRSAAERWAYLVLRACDATSDLPTLRDWASMVAVSYTALTDSCRIIGIPAHNARDFMRILRALCRTSGRVEHLEVELLVADDRTCRTLLERGGVAARRQQNLGPFSPDEFLIGQSFIEKDHPSVYAMNILLADLA